MQSMQITVPLGVTPGQQVQVQAPSGPMLVTIPSGVMAGQILTIQVPATPAPVAQAMPIEQTASVQTQPMPLPMQQLAYPTPVPAAISDHRQHATPLLEGGSSVLLALPVGLPVSEAMPQVPSASGLTDQWSSFQYQTQEASEAGMHHGATFAPESGFSDAAGPEPPVPMGQPVYYTDAELAILNQQPLPADIFAAGVKHNGPPAVGQPLPQVDLPVAQSAQLAMAQPVMTTAAGVPIVNVSTAGISPAETMCISPASPLHAPCISPASPAGISPCISPRHLPCRDDVRAHSRARPAAPSLRRELTAATSRCHLRLCPGMTAGTASRVRTHACRTASTSSCSSSTRITVDRSWDATSRGGITRRATAAAGSMTAMASTTTRRRRALAPPNRAPPLPRRSVCDRRRPHPLLAMLALSLRMCLALSTPGGLVPTATW